MQEKEKQEKKKILFIITKSVWAGAGKYVYDLATNLPKEEYNVCVAAGGQGPLAQKLRDAGAVYYDIKNFQRDISFIGDILAFFEVLKLLMKFKPDILHANSSKAGSIAGAAALIYKILCIFSLKANSYKLKAVFTAHGWAFNEFRPKWQIFLIKFFSRVTAMLYDKIICVSEFDKQSALKNKVAPAKKLITIHNGIDADEYEFLAKEEAFNNLKFKNENLKDENAVIIGTIGEFTKNKGQKYLIEAIKILNEKPYALHPIPYTLIIGWGEDEKSLKLKVESEKLENKVFIVNNLSPAGPYLKAFDIFVLPSIKEGLPYTLLEAGLAELPVIATDVGGNPEIIEHKKTGLLINPADADETANAIKFLIENPAPAKNLASNLREKILEEFSLEKMIEQTLRIYK